MSSINASETSRDNLEMWENPGNSRVVISRLDMQGQKRSELINGGRKFHISPLERRMNQEMCYDESMDIFKNGTLRPVRLIEGTEDAKEIASNPNHLSDDDLLELLKAHHKTFEKRLGDITNVATVERLLELSDQVDPTVSRLQQIRDRITALSPHVEDVQHAATDAPRSGVVKAVTPK